MPLLTNLTQAGQDFLTEIRNQLPPTARLLFDKTLEKLSEPSPEVKQRLAKLDVLEAYGVEDWEGYSEAMEELQDDLDEDDEEDE